jgi:hypothetical protein
MHIQLANSGVLGTGPGAELDSTYAWILLQMRLNSSGKHESSFALQLFGGTSTPC